jgi:pSer/pThr/pTyr-binding forkhead associated (FHA) protein
MLRLIVNPGTGNAWEIPLPPGVVSLGRGPENNYPIEHPSVSTAHCQLTVTPAGVVIKDLGSINGTFVNDAMVDEAMLADGQTIRLGDVVMQFESDEIPRARPIPTVIGTERPALKRAPVPFEPNGSLFKQMLGAFRYPLTGDGLFLLIGGAVMFLVLGIVRTLAGMLGPYGFVLALTLAVFAMGYAFSYAKSIITSTANGENAPPDWPDFTEWQEDIVQPFGQMIALLALTFGPAAILRWWQPGSETFAHAITVAAAVFGVLLAPMGMLALAMLDRIGALNPLLLGASILRIPLHYLAAAAVFELLAAVYFLAPNVIGPLIPVPLLPGIISLLLNLYLTLAGMRILGLLYRAKAEDLGWFDKE